MLTEMGLYELMKRVDALVVLALRHPEATQEDKASLLTGGACLSEVRRNHMPKILPVDPATLPVHARLQAFAPAPGLGRGWLLDHEAESEVPS